MVYQKVGADPLNEYLLRGLNGRQFFYRFGLERMDRWDKHLTGTGLWAPEIELEKVTGAADHFHSIYVATYIHGGLIFDGQSACSLVTHPRFENLLFWFPLVAIAASWRNLQDGRQPSSSASR